MSKNLLESGCAKCAMKGNAHVGPIDIDPHTETVTIDHVCNANLSTFMHDIKQHVENTTNYTFPLRCLSIRNFDVNMKDVVIPPSVANYFSTVRADTISTSLVHFVFFKEKLGFKYTPMYTYDEQLYKLSFSSITHLKDVFWDGWYQKQTIRVLEIKSLYLDKEIPLLTLCKGMQSIHTLIMPNILVSHCPLFDQRIYNSFRNTLVLFAPFLQHIVAFSDSEMCMTFISRALSIVIDISVPSIPWPRLKECTFLNKLEASYYVMDISEREYLKYLPNLHVVKMGQDVTHLRCVQLAPTLLIKDSCFPNIHQHTARVRYRTHMAAHVFKYFCERLGQGKDLARLLTRRYLLYFKYPDDAPTEFLYAPNTYEISKIDFDHLKSMYDRCFDEKKQQEGGNSFLKQAEYADDKLVEARQKAAVAKEAFDEKIIGKRKRLHNALIKCREKVTYWERKKEEAQMAANRYIDMNCYSKQASAAYFKRYVREMLKLGSETRLVVAEKWVE